MNRSLTELGLVLASGSVADGLANRFSLSRILGRFAPSGAEAASKGGNLFGPMNKGPLADDIATTFRSGTYQGVTTTEPTTLYRVIGPGGNPAGSYWTRTPPSGPVQSIIDSALNPQWGNSALYRVRATVPAGTTFYEGAAAAQGGLVGGGNQIFIPKVDPSWIQGIVGF